MAEFVKVENQDRLAIVTVQRPEALNALNSVVLRELTSTFEQLATSEDVGCVILTGSGDKAFVAGADIKQMVGLTGEEMRAFSQRGRELGDLMARMPQPIIAAINGYALGGGSELAMACDIRIASDRAKLGQPEINIGIIPGFGGSQRLPRLVGSGRASELVLTGSIVDAATAERIGWVDHVVPHETLMEEVRTLVRTILSKPPVAVRLAKAAVRAAWEKPLSAGLSLETEAFGVAGGTKDKVEGMTAFLEKRKPSFTGT